MLGPGLATAATNSSMAVAHLAYLTLHLQVFTWSVGFFTSDSQPSLASAVERSVKTLEAQVRQPSAHPSLKETLALMRNTQIYLTRTPPSPLLLLRLKNLNPEAQARALRLLSRRREFFKEAEPLLLAHLGSTNSAFAENAAIALKNYGAEASNALPALHLALQYPDTRVCSEVTNAIMRIAALMNDRLRSE